MTKDISRHYWYPVATVDELAHGPISTRLLGEDLVAFRIGDEVGVLRDLCVHRGTPLSLGSIEDGTLVCAYHGWRYDRQGECVHIPQLPPDQPIPRKARIARVDGYKAQIRYGVVWACLGAPRLPIPDYPEYSDPGYRVVFSGTYRWKAGAARMMENFLDTAHFAYVHPGLLGDPQRPSLDIGPIEKFEDGFGFSVAADVPEPSGGGWQREPVYMRYFIPYGFRLIRERRTEGRNSRYVLFTAIRPISPTESQRYTWLARNYAFDTPDEHFLSFLETLREQDREIVEHQRPEELPLDLSVELHLRGIDAAAVEFRRLLAQLGLEASALPTR